MIKTSPMGWNSWDCYGAAVKESDVRRNAEYMAEHLKDFGWEYIVVDIQWSSAKAASHEYDPFTELEMDKYGRLIPATNRFPSAEGGKGFKPLADYIHGLGLKFGIHIMRGIPRQAVTADCPVLGTDTTARKIAKTNSICAWNTDMYGVDPHKSGAREYYDSIFSLYASWGVDFIKCDDICRELPHEEEELVMLSESLRSCGRDMVLSLSPGPAFLEKAELYKQVSDMWRITDDFWDDWKLLYAMFERAEKWSIHAGNGHWPDADMLPVGALRQCYDPKMLPEEGIPADRKSEFWTRFTEDEQITMLSLWCIMRAPLMIGGEMSKNDEFTLNLLTNREILKMHSCARHSHQVWRHTVNGQEVILWTAVSSEGGTYIAVFNAGSKAVSADITSDDLELEKIPAMTELWTGKRTRSGDTLRVKIRAHGAVVYKSCK